MDGVQKGLFAVQQVQEDLTKNQREFYLRQQMRAIQKELGEGDPRGAEIDELVRKLDEAKLPEAARKAADTELDRLKLIPVESAEHSVLFVAIANGSYYGGGMRIAPDAAADDGSLDVCIVGDITRMTAIRQLPNLYRGTHVNHPAVALARARRVTIEGSAETLAHLDGEPFGGLPLDVELVGGRLTVAVPRR